MTWVIACMSSVSIDRINLGLEHGHRIITALGLSLKSEGQFQITLNDCHQFRLALVVVVHNISDHLQQPHNITV